MYEEEMEDEDPAAWLSARSPDQLTASSNLSTPADLQAMMSAYQDQPTMYTDELKRVRDASSAQQRELEEAVRAAYNRKSEGPSQSELYFKLAQSFLTPGKTGNFMEGVGAAAGAGAEYRGQQRAAREADLNAQRTGGIELGKLRLGAAKEELGTLRSLDESARKDRRAVHTKLLEQYLASGKPQSNVGKTMADLHPALQKGTPEYQQKYEELLKQEMTKAARGGMGMGMTSVIDANGNPVLIRTTPDGVSVVPGYTPAPYSVDIAAELARAKARESKIGAAQGEYQGTQDVAAARVPEILDTLARIETLLPQATGSGAGAVRDRTAAFFGQSTDGAEAAAALRPYANKLTQAVPRMEGPQSNADRDMYEEAAGKLADEKLPTKTREAALATIKEIAGRQAKYGNPAFSFAAKNAAAAPNPATPVRPAAPATKAETVLEYDPATGRYKRVTQ